MSQYRNVAVVGFAQAPIVSRDLHHTAQEMLYPQVRRVLEDCGVSRDDIDYQVAGSSDYIDGRPFGFVMSLDAMGSWPPRQDLHVEMDAAFAAYYAWLRMQAGDCDTAIVCGYGKSSEGELDRVLNLQLDPFYLSAIGLDPVSTAGLQASAFMERARKSDHDLAELAARNRIAGARNADALLREAVDADTLADSEWVVGPLRRGYLSPYGETAVCLVLAAEGKAESMCDKPVWIHGLDQRIEMQNLGARDLAVSGGTELATRKALEMAGLERADQCDVVELSATNPAEEMILCRAMGLDPEQQRPVINPSGGPLCGNPIMMTGLIRLGEIFRQLSGRAGERAVDGAERGMAHASSGHCLQQNLVFVCGRERRWS